MRARFGIDSDHRADAQIAAGTAEYDVVDLAQIDAVRREPGAIDTRSAQIARAGKTSGIQRPAGELQHCGAAEKEFQSGNPIRTDLVVQRRIVLERRQCSRDVGGPWSEFTDSLAGILGAKLRRPHNRDHVAARRQA